MCCSSYISNGNSESLAGIEKPDPLAIIHIPGRLPKSTGNESDANMEERFESMNLLSSSEVSDE
jgi:hypothetical protein